MADKVAQFLDRTVDIGTLLFQFGDVLAAFFDRHPALFDAAIVEIVEIDHLADFDQREADVLRAHDPGKPRPVAR